MKWLVTAFEPFDTAATNSSLIVLEELRGKMKSADLIFHSPVPVAFDQSWNDIRQVIDKNPDIEGILALGQAHTRTKISLERVALNWIDARIPDNKGISPPQAPIRAGSPDMHWSNIPWEKFETSPYVERSYTAGTYLCNLVMFEALEWAVAHKKKAGFVHLPVLSSQHDPVFAKSPRLDVQVAVKETARILEFLLKL